jgi:3-oxoacyl-[acyl-carrier-protein] synthase II
VNRRVVVTGIGLVSALGIGTNETWAALLAGRSGVTRITKFDRLRLCHADCGGGEGVRSTCLIEKKDIKKMDLFISTRLPLATVRHG